MRQEGSGEGGERMEKAASAMPSFDSFPAFASSSAAPTSQPPPVFDSFPDFGSGDRQQRKEERGRRRRSRSRSETPGDRAEKKRRKEEKKARKRRAEKGKSVARDGSDREQEDDDASAFLKDLGRDMGLEERRPKSHREKSHSRPSRPSPRPPSPPTARPIDTDPPPLYGRPLAAGEKRLFVVDLKDDTFNLRWGRPERGKIPKYRRTGAGRVLGLHENLRIVLSTAYRGEGLQISPFGQHRAARLVDSSSGALLNDRILKRIVLQPRRVTSDNAATLSAEANEPFIPLSNEKPSHRALEHEPGQDYRSVLGMHDPDRSLASEAESSSSDDDDDNPRHRARPPTEDGGESLLDRLSRRKAELESLTRKDPTDVDAWLACVALQDELREAGLVGIRASRGKDARSEDEAREEEDVKRQIRGTAEVKVAYLERALGVAKNAGNLRLIRAYLKAYGQKPDVDYEKVDRKWRDMLRGIGSKNRPPQSTGQESEEAVEARMSLWIDYVGWRMGDGGSFKIDEIVKLVEEGMDTVKREFEDESMTSPRRAPGEQTLLYLFHRCCVMLRQAGYTERALALFQALIELNFFAPPAHPWSRLDRSSSPEDVLAAQNELLEDFELFWDSEAPRIGEDGARGWGQTPEDAEPLISPESSTTGNGAVVLGSVEDPVKALDKWQENERTGRLRRLKPARTLDSTAADDDDPYRVIVFEDLRNLLFAVVTPDARQQLTYAFLSFLGLPLVPPDVGTNAAYFTDAFLSSDIADSERLQAQLWHAPEPRGPAVSADGFAAETKSGIRHPFASPFKVFPASVTSLFAPADRWFVPFDQDQILSRVDAPFVRHVFQLLVPALRTERYFAVSALSFEARVDPAGAARLAKSWLSIDASNVLVWDAHARIARLRGRIKEMRNAYATTLEMGAATFTGQAVRDLTILWHSWVEAEFDLGNDDLALRVAVACVGGTDDRPTHLLQQSGRPSGPSFLRARKAFSAAVSAALQPRASPDVTRHRLSLVTTFALFEYLSKGFDGACAAFEYGIASLQSLGSSNEEEELWVSYTKLLYHHLIHSTLYRPAVIRSVLQRAVKAFPQNSVFTCLFAYNEARMKIQNETRLLVERSLLRSADVTPGGWLFAVWVELHINAAGFNKEAVRSLFERAVANDRTCYCAQIWILYADFELKYGQKDRARRVLARAHAACPWSKDLYLPPFSAGLSTSYSVSPDLERFVRLMGEKALRISSDPTILLSRLASQEDVEGSEDEVEKAERMDRQQGALLSL